MVKIRTLHGLVIGNESLEMSAKKSDDKGSGHKEKLTALFNWLESAHSSKGERRAAEKKAWRVFQGCLDQHGSEPSSNGKRKKARAALCNIFSRYVGLSENATRDELTGNLNLKAFKETLRREILEVRRQKTAGLVVAEIDFDGFKRLNDTYGHAAGDYVLIKFSKRLREKLRGTDFFCRRSGDEFLVLATHTNLENFRGRFETMLSESIRKPVRYEGQKLQIRASCGYSEYDEETCNTVEALLKEADANMYARKMSDPNKTLGDLHRSRTP